MTRSDKALTLILITVSFFLGVALTGFLAQRQDFVRLDNETALHKLYEAHRWVVLYEDGAYSAETDTGYRYQGCLPGAECNEN